MTELVWKVVDPFGKCPQLPCIVTDGPDEQIWFASTAFEYYDAKYWTPYPRFAEELDPGVITSDEVLVALARMREEEMSEIERSEQEWKKSAPNT